MKTLHQIGERALIRRLLPTLPTRPDLVVPAGDDCAVVRWMGRWDAVLKSDSVVEGVHFLPDAAPARVGHKALARVLSDFASMGAEPQHVLVNLVAPPPPRSSASNSSTPASAAWPAAGASPWRAAKR